MMRSSLRKGRVFVLMLGLMMLSFCVGSLTAQTDTGRVQGSVLDNTGAALPGAVVSLTNVETNTASQATADAAGNFTFSVLVRGNYKAEVHAQGFQSQVQSFQLEVSQVQSLNFKLNPGEVSQTVTVSDAAPVVDLATSSTGTVIQGRQVTELPLNGRNFTQLAVLTPGVTRGAYGSDAAGANGNAETWRNSDTGSAALSVNGTRTQANNFELDGLDNNDSLVNTIIFFPPVEATQEFRVNTSMAPAEFGRAGGAIVQTSIKSGTNEFHGSAFFFDRDKIFDASPNYFSPTDPAPSFHRVQYGGTFGLPFWKDKLFGFVDYQGSRSKAPEGESFNTVPTALMRTGDFSELLGTGTNLTTTVPYNTVTGCNTQAGPNGTIYDPVTCAAFPKNVIPTARMTQAGLNYLNAFPLPNHTAAQGNTSLTNNYVSDPTQVQRYDDFDGRLDFRMSQHDSFFGRYSYGQDVQIKSSVLPNLPAGFGSGTNPAHPRGEAAGWTHVFTPNLVNEFRYGYIHTVYGYVPPLFNQDVSANLGITNANRNANLGGGAAINGGSFLAYTGDGGLYTIPQWSNQFVDEISWTHGAHTVKFGASIEKRVVQACCASNSKGYFDFSSAHFTGDSMSDVLAGFVDDYSIGVASNYFTTKNWETGYFVQDDWKATRRLTLNLGFRYDLYTFPYEQNNFQSNFDLTTQTLQQAGTDGLSRSIVHTDKSDFAPRIGFAYNVSGDGKTSLRGGYGIFYFLDRGGINNQLFDNPDFDGSVSYSDLPTQGSYRLNFAGAAPNNPPTNNNLAVNGPLPLPVFGQTVDRANPINSSLISVDPHLPTSMIQQWNLQLQQQLNSHTSVTFAYVGTNAQHLRSWFNLNGQILDEAPSSFLYPKFASIERGIANGRSNYNGLQVFLNSAMSHGIQYTAAYTWSHTLDDSNGAFSTGTASAGTRIFITPNGPDFKSNYGNSDQDQRQVLTFSALTELPVGRGRRFGSHMNPVMDKVVGGWQLNAIATMQTGSPFDVSTNDYFSAATGQLASGSLSNRVDLTKQVHYTKSLHEWFDTSAFAHPAVIDPSGQTSTFTAPGTLGRNYLTGPAYRDLDMSLFKNFPIMKTVTGEFRAEAYNLTNTPAFTNPNGNMDTCSTAACPGSDTGSNSGSFGQINGTRFHSERQIQLAFRLQF